MAHVTRSVALALAVSGIAMAATPCPPGAFDPHVARSTDLPLFGADSAAPAFVLGTDTVTIGACGAAGGRIRAARHFTKIRRIVWDDCPGFGRVRYQGFINYPACRALVGILRWHDQSTGRRRALKFESLRIDP